jgi:hypothetical protein
MYMPDNLTSMTDIFVDFKDGVMLTVRINAMGFTQD